MRPGRLPPASADPAPHPRLARSATPVGSEARPPFAIARVTELAPSLWPLLSGGGSQITCVRWRRCGWFGVKPEARCRGRDASAAPARRRPRRRASDRPGAGSTTSGLMRTIPIRPLESSDPGASEQSLSARSTVSSTSSGVVSLASHRPCRERPVDDLMTGAHDRTGHCAAVPTRASCLDDAQPANRRSLYLRGYGARVVWPTSIR